MKKSAQYILGTLALMVSLVAVSAGHSSAAIQANMAAINAEIAAATATGVDAKTAAFNAVSAAAEQAFNTAKANDPKFADSAETVVFDIMVAFGALEVPELEPLEIFGAAREGVMVGSGLENTAVIDTGVQLSAVKVKEIVCLRLGQTLDECPIDYAPALEAYQTPDGAVGLEAYQNPGQNIRTLIRRWVRALLAWIRDNNHASRV